MPKLKSQETRVRRFAVKHVYRVVKSRVQLSADNKGFYQLVETRKNQVVMGSRFDAELGDIEWYIRKLLNV